MNRFYYWLTHFKYKKHFFIYLHHIYTYFNVLKRSLLCSPMLQLFDQHYIKTVCELLLQLIQFEYIIKCNLFLWCKAEFLAVITPSEQS